MPGQIEPITVGFYDPFNVYPTIEKEITQKVQLTNLHWRKNSNDALRSIPQLPFKFVEETPKGFDNNPHPRKAFWQTDLPLNSAIDLITTPYARVMFVQCENTDSYKAQVRPLVEAWKESNILKSNAPTDWYIIYYIPNDTVSKSQLKVFEKLKVDNSEETSEHCLILKFKYSSTLESTESWNLLISKLKSGVLYSFSNKLQLLRDALLSKISDPTLLVCVKEGLARQFLNFHLLEDALNEYDSLQSLINEHSPEIKAHDEGVTSLEDFLESRELITKEQPSTTIFNAKCYIFTKQLIILELLADTAPSLSISSLHVSEFLRRFHFFILDITRLFENSSLINEWVYKTINEVLTLDICAKISSTEIPELQNSTVNLISERFGELLILQRTELLQIGRVQCGYQIAGILTDILVSESKSEITYEPLKLILSTKEKFEEQFIALTQTAIEHYSISGRPRTVDSLSIDIALLDYQNGQYAKAALVLSTCPEFYQTTGWKFIGVNLLETYIDCLEHIDENDEFFEEAKLLIQAKNCLLLLSYIQEGMKVSEVLIEKALKFLSIESGEDSITFDLEKLFKVKVQHYVIPSGVGDNTYSIDIVVNTHISNTLKLKNLELLLSDEHDHYVSFSSRESSVQGNTIITLKSSQVILGSFKLNKLSARLGPVLLSQSFTMDTDVFIYPSPNDLSVRVNESTSLFLSGKSFSIFVHPQTPITDVFIEFKQLNDILEVQTSLKLIDGDTTTDLAYDDGLSITSLEAKEYEVIVPYVPGIKSTRMDLFVKVRFNDSQSIVKSQGLISSIDTALNIAVSVQDIFKTESMYSKFSVGTADIELPIRILSVILNENQHYTVSSALKSESLIAFGEQPGNYFFKIEKKKDIDPEEVLDQFLKLEIKYRNLFEEVHTIWKKLLWNLLLKNNIEKYFRLISEWLVVVFDYQGYAIDSMIKVSNSKSLNYSVLKAINISERRKVKDILTKFIQESHSGDLDLSFIERHLLIAVPIPIAEVLHTVQLKYDNSKIYTILGEELATQLDIRSIVNKIKKATTTKKSVTFQREESNIFEVEVLNNQDTWLINGKTKFTFEIISDSHDINESLSLIPLKVGKLGLPKVRITKVGAATKDESYMEVDYKNENETIYVVSEKS